MDNQKRLSWLSLFQMLGITLLLLTIGIWQVWGCTKITFIGCFAGLLSLGGAAFFSVWFKTTGTQFQRNTGLMIVLEILCYTYLVINITEVGSTIGDRTAVSLVVALAAVAVMQILQLILLGRRALPSKSKVLKALLLAGISFVFAFLLNIECFNTWTHWDSHAYFCGIQALSAKNIFLPGSDGLSVCAHAAVSYALWSLLFKSIPGITHLNALYLSNMALIAIDFYLFFLLFRRLFPGKGFIRHTLSATAATVTPWIFGLAIGINAEHLLMTGALMLLYAVFSENYLLSILSVFVLCGARETGGGVAAFVIFLQLVYSLYRWKKDKAAKVNWAYYLMSLSLGVIWLWQTLFTSNWMSVDDTAVDSYRRALDGSRWNRFGIFWPYIKDVLCQTFLVNFRWIFTGLVLAALIVFVVRRLLKKGKRSALMPQFSSVIIAAALFVSVVEQCAFITFNHPRYYTMSNMLLSVLGICSMQYLVEGLRWEKVTGACVTGALAIVLLIQSYITIDPVTTTLYSTMGTGKFVVASAPQCEIHSVDPAFHDAAAYNRQEMYFLKTLDMAYAKIDSYSDGFQNVTILCSDEYVVEEETILSLYAIWGYGYTVVDPPMYGHWNREGGYRYLAYEMPEYSIDPLYVGAGADLSGFLDAGRDVFYIEMPWWDTVIGPIRERYPNTQLFATVEHMGWVMNVYKIQ